MFRWNMLIFLKQDDFWIWVTIGFYPYLIKWLINWIESVQNSSWRKVVFCFFKLLEILSKIDLKIWKIFKRILKKLFFDEVIASNFQLFSMVLQKKTAAAAFHKLLVECPRCARINNVGRTCFVILSLQHDTVGATKKKQSKTTQDCTRFDSECTLQLFFFFFFWVCLACD